MNTVGTESCHTSIGLQYQREKAKGHSQFRLALLINFDALNAGLGRHFVE